jgi:hypothetical protein
LGGKLPERELLKYSKKKCDVVEMGSIEVLMVLGNLEWLFK